MKTATRTKVNEALRDEWLRNFQDLHNQIKTWIYANPYYNWTFEEIEAKEIEESPLGLYTISVYKIDTPEGEVRLEPIARNYPGRGIVELYAWPTLRRVRLIQDDNDIWKVLTDSGIFLHQDWSRDNFVRLVQDLIEAG